MAKVNGSAAKVKKVKTEDMKRSYLSQSDIPNYSLEDALKIPEAIIENYAGKPVTPLKVAQALNVSPSSAWFRMNCGSAIAYGLTKGGYNANEISLEPLVVRIFKPKVDGDDVAAKIEAFLAPRIIKEFFTKYNGESIPKDNIAKNVLEEFGVPADRLDEIFSFMIAQGEELGLIIELKGKKYIQLERAETVKNSESKPDKTERLIHEHKKIFSDDEFVKKTLSSVNHEEESLAYEVPSSVQNELSERQKKVFITHGKNTKFIDPIKKLLSFGELMPVVSVEKTSVSQPVPDKVMNDMRSCGAAIIHVEDELKLMDDKVNEHIIINPNVLIEIGAAMALYGRRFILLVKNGIKLPSNLQGLFEVRYNGDELDGNATIKLMEAINDIKNQALPV